jgi:predicted flap endonuclease-1-like 5' DNA nuclease
MDFDFNQLFEQFNTPESYTILALMLIAFLFGLIAGRLLRGGRVRRLRRKNQELEKEVDAKDRESADQQDALATANGALSAREKEMEQLRRELEEVRGRVRQMEQKKARLYKEISGINAEVEKLQATNQSYLTTIDDLNNQIVGLKTRNEQLAAELERQGARPPDQGKPEQAEEDYGFRNRLEIIERKMLQIESENISLKQELDELRDFSSGRGYPQAVEEVAPFSEAEPSVLLEKPQPPDSIPPSEEERDDLTMIKGIGTFIAKKLNEQNIFTFEQISRWDNRKIREITEKLEYFEGRIEKDDWVGQARRLYNLKVEDPESFHRLSAHPSDPEDLKIIEGVGPKIEKLLKDSGIYTWEDLADSSAEHLRSILDAAGDTFRIHDPETWPVQARLAVNSDWNLLKDYQQQLKGGRDVPPEEE